VKPGNWNHFRLVVLGKTAELLINGKQVWKIDNLTPATGLIGRQCEVPAGGQFLFRTVRFSERQRAVCNAPARVTLPLSVTVLRCVPSHVDVEHRSQCGCQDSLSL
jgi:hypothetical protein